MEAALIALALLLFGGRKTDAQPQAPKQPPAAGGSAPPPQNFTDTEIGKVVTGAAATLGGLVVTKVVTAVAGAVGAGGAASAGIAGAAGGVGATTATAGGAGTGGGLGGGAAVVGGTGGGGGAAVGNAAAAITSIGAGSSSIALVMNPVTLLAAVAIINAISNKIIEAAKNFKHYLGLAHIHFWTFHKFEIKVFEFLKSQGVLGGATFEYREVEDQRLWVKNNVLGIEHHLPRGYYAVTARLAPPGSPLAQLKGPSANKDIFGQDLFEVVNGKGGVAVENFCRSAAFENARWRARYAGALMRNWDHQPNAPSDLTTWDKEQYGEAITGIPGLGGLQDLPGIFGRTVVPRQDPSDSLAPVGEQKASPMPVDFQLPSWARELAQLTALADAMRCVRWDPTVYFPWNPVQYAADLHARLELSGSGVQLVGSQFLIPAASFPSLIPAGTVLICDITLLKDKKPAWFGPPGVVGLLT